MISYFSVLKECHQCIAEFYKSIKKCYVASYMCVVTQLPSCLTEKSAYFLILHYIEQEDEHALVDDK